MIEPKYFTLSELIGRRVFEIPDYQRAYSWGRRQVQDLIDDIEKLRVKNTGDIHHFMATIVCYEQKKDERIGTDIIKVYDIVDGQQRITTLTLLLKAIQIKLQSLEGDSYKEEAANLQKSLVHGDGRLLVLQTNHDNNRLFANYLRNGKKPQTEELSQHADRNLRNAISYLEDYVERSSNILDLLSLVKNQIAFIFYALQEEGLVHTIFEVLNSRGLQVDWLDKCKSVLMGIAYEKRKSQSQWEQINNELKSIWKSIYQKVGLIKIDGSEILAFAATLKKGYQNGGTDVKYLRKTLMPDESLEFFRELCLSNYDEIIEVSNYLLKVTSERVEMAQDTKKSVLYRIKQSRLLCLSIRLIDESILNQDSKAKLLLQWEKVSFRIFGLYRDDKGKTNDARVKVGEFTSLACEITHRFVPASVKNKSTADDLLLLILPRIKKLGDDYSSKKVSESLRNKDCYNDVKDELLYFFFELEKDLLDKSRRIGSTGTLNHKEWETIWKEINKSIEHILPQSPQIPNWPEDIALKVQADSSFINRLGNLVLYPLADNITAGNKSFAEKIALYKEVPLRILNDIIYDRDKSERVIWNEDSIVEREEALIEWASKYFDDIDI
jgi:hypothetical protein